MHGRDVAFSPNAPRQRAIRLGLSLMMVLMVAYFGFIGLGAFAPSVLAKPVVSGGIVTLAFAYGLTVIGLGAVLTGVYVWITNRAELMARTDRSSP
jgi:uncharacterized membrane protein (DUF485 family)